uniref:Uncharacterized protein n=1 Tax=Rhizophora mucronata TaxID=61149 RepID=A0A2P2NMS4_RHIMU
MFAWSLELDIPGRRLTGALPDLWRPRC